MDMPDPLLPPRIAALPKAELHLHLEGSIQPATVAALTARHGVPLTEEEVRRRYSYRNFAEFIEAFKWVTSFLREPQDYALITADLAEHLLTQHVVYAEITLSIGVMLLRGQQPEANFDAILAAAEPFAARGLHLRFVFDAVRQFGPEEAMLVVEAAERHGSRQIVAFGIGGDELSVPTAAFRGVYDKAASIGLRRLMHAGEVGGPGKIREAIELLGAERIGHGIAAILDPALMDFLADRRIPLEVCPTSNLRTGALQHILAAMGSPGRGSLSRMLSGEQSEPEREPRPILRHHPLPALFRHGIPVVLSTDDPAMFHTTLAEEYRVARETGLSEPELAQLVAASFEFAFALPPEAARPSALVRAR
jgi:adenosine deaminase